MKVAILSMQRIQNYGSLLQAYVLKKTLENLNCEVEFIDIKKNPDDYNDASGHYFNFKKEYERRGFQLKKLNKYLFIRIKHKVIGSIGNKQNLRFEEFSIKELDITRTSTHYDMCLIGSDEVFSCMDANWWGFTSQLFGNVPEADNVVTYAASCGATKFENLPKAVELKIRKSFQNISHFSVRDENTKLFVEKLTTNSVSFNLDPVLIYDFEQELKKTSLPKLPRKYCVIYAYVNRINNDKEIQEILRFCKRNGLTPITVYGTQFWCNKHVDCSPFECLKIINNSEFVITDTFHGAIFSTKYAKRFAVIVRESNRNKLGDLINRIGINEHTACTLNDLQRIYEHKKNDGKINSILEEQRRISIKYLKVCLGCYVG